MIKKNIVYFNYPIISLREVALADKTGLTPALLCHDRKVSGHGSGHVFVSLLLFAKFAI